jgi:ankyrin repeat protein
LILALINLHFDTAKELIDQGADIHLWDFQGQTPLYAAVDTSTVPRGARPDVASTDATTAMQIINLLISRGVNVNAQLKLRLPGRAMPGDRNADFRVLNIGATPLMRAAVAADIPAMQALLKAGALVDLPIADGMTPLFASVMPATGRARFKTQEQALEAMRVLKAAGADPLKAVGQSSRVLHLIHIHLPNHARVPGTTALMIATIMGWQNVTRELVSYGVDINAKDADGMTALDYAMGRERYGFLQVKPPPMPEMAALLKELGATVESPNAPPWPPLSTPQIRALVPEVLYF